jgi:hypothetical protein
MRNAQSLKAQLQQEATGSRRGLPFKKLAVSHSTQEFLLRDGELEQNLGKEVDIFVSAEFGQYFFFDPKIEKITVLSQIVKPAFIKQALDLKSGRKMAEIIEKMKAQNTKPTYTDILVVLVKTENGWEEALFYVKGALLQSWFEIVKEIGAEEKIPIGNIVRLTLKAQKKGSVKYSTLSLVEFIDCKDEDLVATGVALLNKFKESIKLYNQYEPVEEEPVINIEETNNDDVEF